MSIRGLVASARFRALLSLGMVLGLGAVGTLAAWSTATTTNSGLFTTGSIDIQLNGNQGATAVTAYTVFSPSATVNPGQSIAVLLPVQNKGTVAFTYVATAVGQDPLGDALQVSARYDGATVTTTSAGSTCAGGTASALSVPRARAVGSPDDSICLQFTLPITTMNVASGQTGSVLFKFTATSP